MASSSFLAALGLPISATAGLAFIAAVLGYIFWTFNGVETKRWWRRRHGEQHSDGGSDLIHIPWALISLPSAYAAPAGLFLAFIISIFRNYKAVTAVHCGRKVREFLPSCSACIGDFSTQRWIWQTGMTLYVGQRLLTAPLYYQMFGVLLAGEADALNGFRCFFFTCEQLCLMLLTIVPSKEFLLLHQVFLFGFAICSVFDMATTLAICIHWRRNAEAAEAADNGKSAGGRGCWEAKRRALLLPLLGASQARLSVRWRGAAMASNYVLLLGMVYWYLMHTFYCQSNMYSYFAMCEWTFIITNILFHYCEFSECRGLTLLFSQEKPHQS